MLGYLSEHSTRLAVGALECCPDVPCYEYITAVLNGQLVVCVIVLVPDLKFASPVAVFFCRHSFHEDCLPAHAPASSNSAFSTN